MNNLPIPTTRSGWVAALINTVILFGVYYWLLFAVILDVYSNQLEVVDFDKGEEIPIKVTIKRPKYYDSSATTWVFLYIENQGEDALHNVEVYLITHSSEPPILLPSLYNNDVYNVGVKFSIIEPRSVATGRIRFIAQTDPQFDALLIKINGNPKELKSKSANRMNESKFKAFRQGFLETLLLPPWSNGFLFAIALFSSYIVEKNLEEKKPGLSTRELLYNWKKSILVLLIIIALIALLMVYELIFELIFELILPLFIVSEVVLVLAKKLYKKENISSFMTIGIVWAIIGAVFWVKSSDVSLWAKNLGGFLALVNLILVVVLAILSPISFKHLIRWFYEKIDINHKKTKLQSDAKQPAEEDQTVKGLEDRVVALEKGAEHLNGRIDDITSRLMHLETYCMEMGKKQSDAVNNPSTDDDQLEANFVCLNCGHAYTSKEIKDKLTPCVQCGQYKIVEQDHP